MAPHYAEGVYECEIVGQGLNTSKTKGTPGVFLDIVPQNGQYDRRIQWWITDKTVDFVIRDLRLIGFAGESWSELDPTSEKFYDFTGKTIQAQCRYERDATDPSKVYERWELPYEGKPRETIRLDKKQVRKLDMMFGKQLKAAKLEAPAAQPVAPPTKEELEAQIDADIAADDGIPF